MQDEQQAVGTERYGDRSPYTHYVVAALACLAVAAVATPFAGVLDVANIAMLFLLAVLLVALRAGRGPAVLSALLSVLLFDFLFVPPRFSLAVGDVQYLITLGVMLAVALITAQLTTGVKRQAEVAARREREARLLYALARDLAGAAAEPQVTAIVERFMHEFAGMQATVLLPDANDELRRAGGDSSKLAYLEARLALLAYRKGEAIAVDALETTGQAIAYVPLKAPMRVRGVLALAPSTSSRTAHAQIDAILPAFASLVAIAVERLHYVDVANRAEMETASERLRNSILSALSHDVRTPLTSIIGLADSLTLQKPPLSQTAAETAAAIRDQSTRLAAMVTNLLDMARLAAGGVRPRKEWHLLEEVAGAAVQLLGRSLAGHRIVIDLPRAMPLIEFDAVLIERVLCNLIENAAKYSPPGTTIAVRAKLAAHTVEVGVEDDGAGFPEGRRDDLFAPFVRGRHESSMPGAGLGLAISRSIVAAHGGTIRAENRAEGGARVMFTLPLGSPPEIVPEIESTPVEAPRD
jgi:two-component system sensor histidine kinase KdpD